MQTADALLLMLLFGAVPVLVLVRALASLRREIRGEIRLPTADPVPVRGWMPGDPLTPIPFTSGDEEWMDPGALRALVEGVSNHGAGRKVRAAVEGGWRLVDYDAEVGRISEANGYTREGGLLP